VKICTKIRENEETSNLIYRTPAHPLTLLRFYIATDGRKTRKRVVGVSAYIVCACHPSHLHTQGAVIHRADDSLFVCLVLGSRKSAVAYWMAHPLRLSSSFSTSFACDGSCCWWLTISAVVTLACAASSSCDSTMPARSAAIFVKHAVTASKQKGKEQGDGGRGERG
jgi:hypothetical protein